MWRTTALVILGIWHFVNRKLGSCRRRRALETVRRIFRSRSGSWKLPMRSASITMVWLGDDCRKHVIDAAKRLAKVAGTAYRKA